MKKLLFILFLIPITANCQWNKKLDAKNGFRNAIFGMDVKEFKDTVLVREKGNVKTYTRTIDEMFMGDVKLEYIFYRFYKNKLYKIMITTKGTANSIGFFKVLEAGYGSGLMANRYISEYGWYGKKVSLEFEINSITGDGTMNMSSNELVEQEMRDQEKSAKESANSL